jgi:hypothetical protein
MRDSPALRMIAFGKIARSDFDLCDMAYASHATGTFKARASFAM